MIWLPFVLLGDLFYSAVFFGAYELASSLIKNRYSTVSAIARSMEV